MDGDDPQRNSQDIEHLKAPAAEPSAPRANRRQAQRVDEVFGDTNLAVVVLIIALLMYMQRAMAPPCTC